jgi:hypothetical protein
MKEIGVLILHHSAPHRSANSFLELEKNPFSNFSEREIRAEQSRDLYIRIRLEVLMLRTQLEPSSTPDRWGSFTNRSLTREPPNR